LPSRPASPIDLTHDSAATDVERPEHPTARRRTTPANVAPTAETEQLRPRTARRQAGTSATADRDTMTAGIDSALAQQDNALAAATDSEAIPALNTPNQPTRRTQRRAKPVSKHMAADATPPTMISPALDALASEGPVDVDPATETNLIAAPTPTAIVQPAGLAIETDEALARVPPSDLPGLPLPTSDATVTSVLASDATTLQLTADEVRLIRHWRQLHPHGRRATLHYIGSLLVDE
jgi:hypothetical protein